MGKLVAPLGVFFVLLSFGQENQISSPNQENLKNVQEFDSTFLRAINEEDIIGVWYTTAVTNSKYRSNPYPRFKYSYSFKKDFSIVFVRNNKMTSGIWSLSANNILTFTTFSDKIVYQISYFKDGVLILASSNAHITLNKARMKAMDN